MIKKIKKHWGIIIIAFSVGLMSSFPQIISTKIPSNNFQGIYQEVNSDEMYYLARGKDIIDGHHNLSNPYLYEHKKGIPMQFWLPDYLMAKPLALLGININMGYRFYDFILTAILTILTYIILLFLTGSLSYGLFGTNFIILGETLMIFNRAPSPQFNFIFCLLLIIFFLKLLREQKPIYLFLTIVSFGILFHLYPYYWTFFLIFLGLFFLINWLKNGKINQNILYSIIGGLIIGIPYFISTYHSTKLPFYKESLIRLGMLNTHFPSGIFYVSVSVFFLITFFILYKKRIIKINLSEIFLLSGLISIILMMNQHIITGKNLEFSTHYSLIGKYFFLFTLIYIIKLLIAKIKHKKYQKIIICLLLSSSIMISFNHAYKVIRGQINFNQTEIYHQNYIPIINWLNKNTKKETVIYANNDLSAIIPVYTNNNVFYQRNANLFFISDEEVKNRFLINNYWENINEEFIIKNERSMWGTQFINTYLHNQSKNKLRKWLGMKEKKYIRLPKNKIEEILQLSKKIKEKTFKQNIKNYKIDYIVWDKQKNPNWGLEKLNIIKPVFINNQFIIYKII